MGPVASSQWINPLCCSFLCTLFPCSHVVAPWSAGHYLLWCLQQTPWMTLRFSESFLTCFFSFWFLFLTDIFALSQEYFPKEPHIWLWVSAACHVRGLWSQLNSLESAWDSPSLFPQRPVLLLLIVNPWAQPPHAVSYLPNTAITSRQHYSVQGMDPSALLSMLYCLPIQANRYVRPDKCKEKNSRNCTRKQSNRLDGPKTLLFSLFYHHILLSFTSLNCLILFMVLTISLV